MKKYMSFLIITVIILSCCKPNNPNSTDTSVIEEIKIDAKEGIIYPLDSLFSGKVWFVKLETKNDNLIGEVSNIFFDDDLIFVVDANKTKSVFIFNMDGTYCTKISSFGNGPGEYSLMFNVFLLKDKKEIVVIDIPQRKQIHYSYSGEFISEDNYSFPAYNCEILESGNKVYYVADLETPDFENPENNVLVVTDDKNKIIYSACNEFKSESFNLFQQKEFWKYDDELYFYPDYSDTLFLITDNGAVAKYHIDVIRDKMPHPSQIEDVTTESFIRDYLNKYYYFDGRFIELEDLTYLELANAGLKIIYSHNTKNTYLCIDKINTLYQFFSKPIARYEKNTIVEATVPIRMLDYKKYLYEDLPIIKEKNPEMNIVEMEKNFQDSLYNNLEEEDNPVLFFYGLNTNL